MKIQDSIFGIGLGLMALSVTFGFIAGLAWVIDNVGLIQGLLGVGAIGNLLVTIAFIVELVTEDSNDSTD